MTVTDPYQRTVRRRGGGRLLTPDAIAALELLADREGWVDASELRPGVRIELLAARLVELDPLSNCALPISPAWTAARRAQARREDQVRISARGRVRLERIRAGRRRAG